MGFKFKDEMGGCWDPFFRGFAVVLGRERRPLPVQTADLCALFRNIRMEESHEPPPGSLVFIGLKWLLTKPVDRLLTPTSFFSFSHRPRQPSPALRYVSLRTAACCFPSCRRWRKRRSRPWAHWIWGKTCGWDDAGDARLGRRTEMGKGHHRSDRDENFFLVLCIYIYNDII